MTNKTMEILIFLLGYLKDSNFDDESLSDFSESLVLNGYSENEVADALGMLLEKLDFVHLKPELVHKHRETSTRILSDYERVNIRPEMFGYISSLKTHGIVNAAQMEKLIDFCLFAGTKVSEYEIDEMVAAIIFEDYMKRMERDN